MPVRKSAGDWTGRTCRTGTSCYPVSPCLGESWFGYQYARCGHSYFHGKNDEIEKFVALYEEEIIKDNYGKPIRVKTLGQKLYVDSVKRHDIVFGIGPAGTGKTFLAVTLAVTALKRGQVKRIVLTRPAVEAGESLGFCQGT